MVQPRQPLHNECIFTQNYQKGFIKQRIYYRKQQKITFFKKKHRKILQNKKNSVTLHRFSIKGHLKKTIIK